MSTTVTEITSICSGKQALQDLAHAHAVKSAYHKSDWQNHAALPIYIAHQNNCVIIV